MAGSVQMILAFLLPALPATGSVHMITSERFEHRAATAGLTELIIRKVIDSFYKSPQDEVLGPVLNGAIGDHWPAHIERIVLFRLTVTQLGTGYQSRRQGAGLTFFCGSRVDL